jgi:membrane-associated PAP2 superfamily phosphatase
MPEANMPSPETGAFWRRHALWPALLFGAAFPIIWTTHLDRLLADSLFYDRTLHEWIGAGTWWAVDLIHTGGGWIVRAIGITALLTFLLGFKLSRLRRWRLDAAYLTLALILIPSVVGALQIVTNVDCPRDLDGYGGDRPFVSLLGDRPDDLPHAKCFPGSHASSGFALLAVYFLLRDRRPRAARWSLAGVILLGMVFSFGQQARGAHFLSHDLASAAIAWFISLALWHWLLRRRIGAKAPEGGPQETGRQPNVASSTANPAT